MFSTKKSDNIFQTNIKEKYLIHMKKDNNDNLIHIIKEKIPNDMRDEDFIFEYTKTKHFNYINNYNY